MDGNKYQELAMRTNRPDATPEQSKKKRTVLIDRPFRFIWGKCVYSFFYFSGGVIYFLKDLFAYFIITRFC